MQVSEFNLMVGIEGRTLLLFNLGKSLKGNTQSFGTNMDIQETLLVRMENVLIWLEVSITIIQTSLRRGSMWELPSIPLAALRHVIIEGP